MGLGKSETDFHLVNDLPGLSALTQQIWPLLQQWVPNWERGGEPAYAPMRQPVDLYRSSMPQYHAGGARIRDMMSPEWIDQTAPGLDRLRELDKEEAEEQLARQRAAMIMQYGAKGHTASTPMVRSLAGLELGALEQQRALDEQRRFADYQQRMAMQPGLMQMSRQEPYQSADMIGGLSRDIMQAFLQYIALAKPEVAHSSESWGVQLPI
jgi:hypothetical protein